MYSFGGMCQYFDFDGVCIGFVLQVVLFSVFVCLGDCWLFVCDCVCSKVGDDVCIWEWSGVR